VSANLREVDRDQLWLMPPSLADWLPEDHLAWFVLDVVAELDLSSLYADLREDGRGGASYDPAVILAVLVYGYCVGERSSRRIERRLVEDVAFRVVGANQQPDHATLARFRACHEQAIAELFAQVLGLCVSEGLVQTGVVSIDSTKVEANASAWSNRTRQQIATEILAEAERIDAAEDATLGERRGGELPEGWARRRDRRPRGRGVAPAGGARSVGLGELPSGSGCEGEGGGAALAGTQASPSEQEGQAPPCQYH
jgi:transposase